jgi:DNA modification methylase
VSRVLCGDVLEKLKEIESDSVQCCVTSPPYWGLRDYGVEGQIGLEKTPEAYVAKMVEVFHEVRRVLKKDGTLWLNLGDSYAGSGRGRDADGTWNPGKGGSKQETNVGAITGRAVNSKSLSKVAIEAGAIGNAWVKPPRGLKAKDLCGIPWRVAFALQADGWWLRSDIIWSKPNPMPESVTDRPTRAHEYIFLMSKSGRYYYDPEAIQEKAITGIDDKAAHTFGAAGGKVAATPSKRTQSGKKWVPTQGGGGNGFAGHSGNTLADGTTYNLRNKRTVWTITTSPYPEAHFATFPEEIPTICIKAGTKHGDIVLDPFAGSGTTLEVAKRLGRDFIGIELNEKYVRELIEPRLAEINPLGIGEKGKEG